MSSRRWPSKPAATTIASGRKARTAGSTCSSSAASAASSRVPGSSGTLSVAPLAGPGPGLLGVAGPGEAEGRVLVQAHVEDVRVGLERVLDAVAVVGVEVENEHPPARVRPPPVARRDDDVVDEAEAERPRALGVVAGGRTAQKARGARPASTKSIAAARRRRPISAARYEASPSWLSRWSNHSRPESAASSNRSRYSPSWVVEEGGPVGGARPLLEERRAERAGAHPRAHRGNALARLRVDAPGGVFEGALVAHEDQGPCRHGSDRKVAPPPAAVHTANSSGCARHRSTSATPLGRRFHGGLRPLWRG